MSNTYSTNYDSAESVASKGELSPGPRLIAAGWFAVAAVIPVLFFFLTFGGVWRDGFAKLELSSLWFLGAIPISAAALCGFLVGQQIVDPMKRTTAWRATLRGASVAMLSYLLFMAAWGVLALIGAGSRQGGSPMESVSMLLFVFLIGLILMGWLVLIAGAGSGWLLFMASERRGFHDWVMNTPRVTGVSANLWTALAILMFLANLGVLFFFKGSQP